MSSHPAPTGRCERRNGLTWVVLTRRFRAPVEDVWAAVTESDRLSRWIGDWEGDPAEGRISFRMLYEGPAPDAQTFSIDECAPPRLLAVTGSLPLEDGTVWTLHLRLELVEADGVTTLTFAQSLPDPTLADSMGPGWEYYLDRLVAAEAGEDPGSLQFEDYFPALADHYRNQARSDR